MLGYHGLNHNILLLLYTAYGVYFVIVRSRNPWNLAKWILVGMMDCWSSHGWNDQFNHKKNWFPTCNGYLINPTKQTPYIYSQYVNLEWNWLSKSLSCWLTMLQAKCNMYVNSTQQKNPIRSESLCLETTFLKEPAIFTRLVPAEVR